MKTELNIIISRFFKLLQALVIVVLVLILFQKCQDQNTLEKSLAISQMETTHFKNSLGKITASNEVLIFQNKKQLKDIISKDKELNAMSKEFNEPTATLKIVTITKFDTIKEVFKEPIPCVFERYDSIKNEWYKLTYHLNEKALEIKPFETWTDINVVTGFKRKWFLGKQTYTTDIISTNPHLTIPVLQSQEVKVPVKWYQTTLFKVGVGFLGGVLIK